MTRILALSPHTDDIELGAGGYIAQAVMRGDSVIVAAFSIGNPETGAVPDEYEQSMEILGVTNSKLFEFECRHFENSRQEILELIERLGEQYLPDIVLCSNPSDSHQDHQTIAREAVRMFKRKATILAYELTHNFVFWTTRPNWFTGLTQAHINRKIAALECYKSQRDRVYFQPDMVEAIAKMRGLQIGREFAEAFEVLRVIE